MDENNKKTERKKLPKHIVETIKERGQSIVKRKAFPGDEGVVKYSRTQNLAMYDGYDILEHFLMARRYICKTYKIDINALEILLHFAAKTYFTQKEYAIVPKNCGFTSIKWFLTRDLFSIVSAGENHGAHIYALSRQAGAMIRKFYRYLSGEEPIPVDKTQRPPEEQTNYDRKLMAFIQHVNGKPKKPILRKMYRIEPKVPKEPKVVEAVKPKPKKTKRAKTKNPGSQPGRKNKYAK